MKTKKRNIYLLIITIILLAIYFFPYLKSKIVPQKKEFVLKLNPEEVKEITFNFSKEDKQTVVKEDNKWFVIEGKKKLPADQQRIKNIINTLSQLEKKEVVSRKKEKHKELGITQEKKIEIALKNKKKITLYIGDQAGVQKYYIRVNNQNEVFTAENLQLLPQNFKDLSIKPISNIDNVQELRIEYTGVKINLKKEKKDWSANSKKADSSKVNFFLSDLKALQANDVLASSEINLPTNPTITIRITEDKKYRELRIYKKGDTYYAKINTSPYIYKLSKITAENLMKKEKDFLP